MSEIFCCSNIEPFRPKRLDHEAKFTEFMHWARSPKSSIVSNNSPQALDSAAYVVQIVRQVNYGPQESIRYFYPASGSSNFGEATEDNLIQANFEKLNSYKNFRCGEHNRFFEVNLYQRNVVNTHHWRFNLARPSRDIDLALRQKKTEEMEEANRNTVTTNFTTAEDGRKEISRPLESKASLPAAAIWKTGKLATCMIAEEKEKNVGGLTNQTLKSVLRFLLPSGTDSLGPNSIVSLLALDWINADLDLNLELEPMWDVNLTADTITDFLRVCSETHESIIGTSGDSGIDAVEKLVGAALIRVRLLGASSIRGRDRLQMIIDDFLGQNPKVRWVSQHGAYVTRLLVSGPDANILEHCRHRKEAGEVVNHGELNDSDQDYDDYDYYDRYDDDRDSNSLKDYTACDKECGYCGHCDY